MHLRQGDFPCEGSGRAGLSPELCWTIRQWGGGCLSLDHNCMGAALVGAVRRALGWQQLLGVHEWYACYQPQWPQAAHLGMGSGAMRHEEDR